MRVNAGQVVGLLGRMGEGKSTLLKICAGLVPPDSGWTSFVGVQYFRSRLSTLAASGLYYLADADNLASTRTLRDHFRAVCRRYGGGDQDEVIELLKLDSLLDISPAALSGGEQRRAALGVAMLRQPICLLTDEPFRGIDPLTAELTGAAFRRLAATGCAVVLTGHEVRTLVPYLDRVVWMTSGTTYELGTVASAWNHEAFQREYLGPLAGARQDSTVFGAGAGTE
ncbi:MAG TPA: ATP-binding cassette domain-containing protein [Gemmatimonadaceae bacterium]|nr:ATP-binding cassette domain-containing protein [Gemmatimonadaceae bacterium]